MLGAAAGVDCASQRLVEGELVGLVQRDLAVVGDVGGPPQAGGQVVGEEAAAEGLGFLGDLVRRARCEEGVTPHVRRLVGKERRAALPALEAGDGPRGARIENRDPDVRGDGVHLVPQRAVRVAVVSEEQALLVGVARVVEEKLRAPGCPVGIGAVGEGELAQRLERVLERPGRRLLEQDRVSLVDAAELLEDGREPLGVGHREAQGGPIVAPLVGAGHERVPAHPVGAGDAADAKEEGHGRNRPSGRHRFDSLVRENTDCSRPRGSSRVGGAISEPLVATRRAAWRTGSRPNGSPAVTR